MIGISCMPGWIKTVGGQVCINGITHLCHNISNVKRNVVLFMLVFLMFILTLVISTVSMQHSMVRRWCVAIFCSINSTYIYISFLIQILFCISHCNFKTNRPRGLACWYCFGVVYKYNILHITHNNKYLYVMWYCSYCVKSDMIDILIMA